MSDLPTRNQIKKGMKVAIELKENQRTGKLTEGIVKKFLTSSSSHPYGIKVELENGETGRVKKIIRETLTVNSSITSFDVFKIVGKYSNKEDIQEILSDFNLPFSKNKDELLNIIFQNKTIFDKAAKEMVTELYKDELVKVCEKCNFNSKGNVDELKERIMNGLFSMSELYSSSTQKIHSIKNNDNSTFSNSSKFVDLDKKEIPKVENKFDEFKEFYQYDTGIDNLPDSIPNDEKSKMIEDKKQQVRERFVTAVSSFGNDPVGGFVYLGIKSDGTIKGLDKDKRVGNFSDYDDDFANHIRNVMENFLKDDRVFIIDKLQIKFTKRDNKTICIIQVLPALEPLFLHTNKGEKFYVRGPTPRAEHLEGKELFSFIKDRFPNWRK